MSSGMVLAIGTRSAQSPAWPGSLGRCGWRVSAQLAGAGGDTKSMTDRVRLIQRHSYNLLLVHVVWATAHRLPLLTPSADGWLADALRRKAYEAGCRLVACGNAAEHVHVLLRYPSTVRLADAVHRLEGGSSYAWNTSRRSPPLRWQTGYWAQSFGPVEIEALTRYVEGQRAHHRDGLAAEPWQATWTTDDGEPPPRPHGRGGADCLEAS